MLDCKHTSSCFPQGALFRCILSHIMVITFIFCINNYNECLLFSKVLYCCDVFLAITNCCVLLLCIYADSAGHTFSMHFLSPHYLCLWIILGKTELGLANPFSLDLADEDKLSIDIDCHAALVIFSNVIRQRHPQSCLLYCSLYFVNLVCCSHFKNK